MTLTARVSLCGLALVLCAGASACGGSAGSPTATPTPVPTAVKAPRVATATPIVPAASGQLLDAVLQPNQLPSRFSAIPSGTGPRAISGQPPGLQHGLQGMFTSAYSSSGTSQVVALYDYALQYATPSDARKALAQFRFLIQQQGAQLLNDIGGIGDETAAWRTTTGQSNIPTVYVAWTSGRIFSYIFSLGASPLPDGTMASLARKAESNIQSR